MLRRKKPQKIEYNFLSLKFNKFLSIFKKEIRLKFELSIDIQPQK